MSDVPSWLAISRTDLPASLYPVSERSTGQTVSHAAGYVSAQL